MNLVTFLLLCVAGGVGASLRLFIDGMIRARTTLMFPLGTTVINVSGSLLLGVITGLSTALVLPEHWHLVLGAGLLGGYTTFSTASFETVRLLQVRRYAYAAANGFGMLLLSIAAALLGLWIGSLV